MVLDSARIFHDHRPPVPRRQVAYLMLYDIQSQNLIRSQATDCEKGKKLFLSGTAVPQPDRF
eukprot:SAG11_NODE_18226_length_496_cov_4.534005_1_plen_61_part_01